MAAETVDYSPAKSDEAPMGQSRHAAELRERLPVLAGRYTRGSRLARESNPVPQPASGPGIGKVPSPRPPPRSKAAKSAAGPHELHASLLAKCLQSRRVTAAQPHARQTTPPWNPPVTGDPPVVSRDHQFGCFPGTPDLPGCRAEGESVRLPARPRAALPGS